MTSILVVLTSLLGWVSSYSTYIAGTEHLYGQASAFAAILSLAAVSYVAHTGRVADLIEEKWPIVDAVAEGWKKVACVGGVIAILATGKAFWEPVEFYHEARLGAGGEAVTTFSLYLTFLSAVALAVTPTVVPRFFDE